MATGAYATVFFYEQSVFYRGLQAYEIIAINDQQLVYKGLTGDEKGYVMTLYRHPQPKSNLPATIGPVLLRPILSVECRNQTHKTADKVDDCRYEFPLVRLHNGTTIIESEFFRKWSCSEVTLIRSNES
jgi:hypothetical protein